MPVLSRLLLPCLLLSTGALTVQATEQTVAPTAVTEPEPEVPSDDFIRNQLDALGIGYEIDADGDFRVVYALDEGRSQIAFVRSAVESYGSLRIREILSPAYRAEGPRVPYSVALRMLEHGNSIKLGGWGVNGPYATFIVKIAADAPAELLRDALEFAAHAADELEREFTGSKDEF